MKSYFTLIVLFNSLISFSQTWEWVTSESWRSGMSPDVVVDSSGNTYLGGTNSSYGSSHHVYLMKFDPSGEVQWLIEYPGYGSFRSLCIDKSGNIYATFFTRYWQGVLCDDSSGSLLVKYDANGNMLWWKRPGMGIILANATTSDDEIVATGTFKDTVVLENGNVLSDSTGYHKFYLAKFDLNGNCVWAQARDGGSEISVNSLNEIFVRAWFSEILTVGQDTNQVILNPYASIGNYVAKYDSVGQLVWVKQINAGHISGDEDGNSYLFQADSATHLAGYITKYGPSGNLIWQGPRFYSNNWGKTDMTCDNEGNILLAGSYNGAFSVNYSTSYSGSGMFIFKIDTTGLIDWYTMTATGIAVAKISVGHDGSIYAAGGAGEACFGPFCIDEIQGVFISKMTEQPLPTTTGPEVGALFNIKISPNPGSGIFQLSFSEDEASKVRIEIHNATGQLIWSGQEQAVKTFTKSVDLSEQPKGIYFVRLSSDSGTSVQKMIIH